MRSTFQLLVAIAYIAALLGGLWYVFSGKMMADDAAEEPAAIVEPASTEVTEELAPRAATDEVPTETDGTVGAETNGDTETTGEPAMPEDMAEEAAGTDAVTEEASDEVSDEDRADADEIAPVTP